MRQTQQEEDENLRHQLDNDFDSIRSLLFAGPPAPPASGEQQAEDQFPMPVPTSADPPPDDNDKEYDQYVRELALDRRAKPKDRSKTEEELAREEKEALEKAERRRIRRMNGEESGSEDESKGKRKPTRARGGDDLEDDFYEADTFDGLGAGLGEDGAMDELEDGQEDDDDEDESEDEDEDEDEEEDDDDDESAAEEFESASDDSGDEDGEEGESVSLVRSQPKSRKPPPPTAAAKELPYTFPCPETHDEFLEIVEGVDDKDIPTVVKRIRAIHHPSLAEGNKFKLQVSCHRLLLVLPFGSVFDRA